MKKLLAFTAISTAVCFAPVAQAADVPAPVVSWTGFYAGIGVGGGFAFSDLKSSGGGDFGFESENYEFGYDEPHSSGGFDCNTRECTGDSGVGAGLSDDGGIAGFLGRGEIGADYQIDHFVMGLNASFTLGDRNISSSAGASGGGEICTSIPDDDDDDDDCNGGGAYGGLGTKLDLGNSWSIGGRIGYLMTDSTLLFASGGYTQIEATLKSKFQGGAGADAEFGSLGADYNISSSRDEWLDGFYVGGGLETLMTDHISLKLEYRYSDYGSIKTSASASDGGCDEFSCSGYDTGVGAKADVTDHTVMATISYRM